MNTFENNSDIFTNNEHEDDNVISKNLSDFMAKLGIPQPESKSVSDDLITPVADNDISKESAETVNKTKKNNRDDNTGVQVLGGYTFEDMDTAQHDVREDEGKGNEKPDNEKTESDSADNKPKKFTEPSVLITGPESDKQLGE